jgi:hypothetical protein
LQKFAGFQTCDYILLLFCSSALMLYCSTALLLYFSFHFSRLPASRFHAFTVFFTLHGFTLSRFRGFFHASRFTLHAKLNLPLSLFKKEGF